VVGVHAADALASGACAYDPDTKIVTATMDDELEGRILRNGRKIVFFTSSDSEEHACGSATILNTKRIDVVGTGWTAAASDSTVVTLDENLGRLAPGVGRESTPSAEIELRISVVPGVNETTDTQGPLVFAYLGTERADRVTVGANGVDVNADGDVDVRTVHAFGDVALAGAGGNDRLSGGGSSATGPALQVSIRLYGGQGDDRLRGGAANDTLDESADLDSGGNDVLIGGAGDDLLLGGPRNDRLVGGRGEDEAYGNGGYDAFFARDGHADLLRGGTGFDEARVDAGVDGVAGIERLF
jgi:Ca2+-binding RTX toxin-like protein